MSKPGITATGEVTQADRDNAYELVRGGMKWWDANPVKAGEQDDHPLVQAFAAHRAKAVAEERAQTEERFWSIVDQGGLASVPSDMWDALDRIARAARNRDMWKTQCDDQAATITALRAQLAGQWQPIETAPKYGLILLYGVLDPHEDHAQLHCNVEKPTRVTGYWDEIDAAWSPMGGTWLGPWFKPTHWMPLPDAPANLETPPCS